MKLRTLLFWPHLIAGVVAGAVILIMSVTGVLLTYERQLIAWSNSDYQSRPPSPGTPRMPVEAVLARFSEAQTAPAASVIIGADATDPVIVSAGPGTFYLDVYSGRLLGEGRQGMRQFMSDLRSWHRWLAYEDEARLTARAVTGWSNVAFLFIVVSGLYLWFPRRWTWQRIKPVVLFTGARGKARDFNWHNVIGVWCLVPLFIVVISAVPISFPWGNDLVYRAMGENPPAARRGGGAGERGRGEGGGARGGGGGPQREGRGGERAQVREPLATAAGLNGLLARASQQEPEWQTINVRIPQSPSAPVAFAIDRGDGGQPQLRSTLTLDRAGAVVEYETFSSQTPARQMRSVMRFAHTGEVLGLPGQTVAGIATAGSVVLVWTGIALALRRGRAWLGRRSRAGAVVPAGIPQPESGVPLSASSLNRVEESQS